MSYVDPKNFGVFSLETVPLRPDQRAGDGDDGLVFDVLGPLEVRGPGGVLDLGPRQRRLFLLRLLVAERRPVSYDRLAEDLWAGRPPRGAVSSVHAHVSRLRTVLQPARDSPRLLVRDRAGYALLVPPAARTAYHFEAAVERSRQLVARGWADAARAEVDRALLRWRGVAFADAGELPFIRAEAIRLDEARLAAQELRIALLLAAGDAPHAAVAARILVADYPLRESAWCLLIRSLYLGGRAAEALQQYARIRALLAAELGAEPGPALRDLHVAVLRQDVAAIGPGRASVTSGGIRRRRVRPPGWNRRLTRRFTPPGRGGR